MGEVAASLPRVAFSFTEVAEGSLMAFHLDLEEVLAFMGVLWVGHIIIIGQGVVTVVVPYFFS